MIDKETRRKERLKIKIKSLLKTYKNRCLFITLTFNNKAMQLSKAKRERIAREYLKNQSAIYIMNCDYGKKNDREHYHALIVTYTLDNEILAKEHKKALYKIDFEKWQQIGRINALIIAHKWKIKGDLNKDKLTENLANHFLKNTTKNSRLIYSRKVPNYADQLKRIKIMSEIWKKKEA